MDWKFILIHSILVCIYIKVHECANYLRKNKQKGAGVLLQRKDIFAPLTI